MASPQNVELEAAKFLHKLIQESKDEPTKLATKLYVILQPMKASGKENSMPYQVISRAMETVVNQHGLDIEALQSSRLPITGGTQIGDSATTQQAGPSQVTAVARELQVSRAPVGSSRSGHDYHQGSVLYRNGHSVDNESPSSLDSRSANSISQERNDATNWDRQVNQGDGGKVTAKRKRGEPSSL